MTTKMKMNMTTKMKMKMNMMMEMNMKMQVKIVTEGVAQNTSLERIDVTHLALKGREEKSCWRTRDDLHRTQCLQLA